MVEKTNNSSLRLYKQIIHKGNNSPSRTSLSAPLRANKRHVPSDMKLLGMIRKYVAISDVLGSVSA